MNKAVRFGQPLPRVTGARKLMIPFCRDQLQSGQDGRFIAQRRCKEAFSWHCMPNRGYSVPIDMTWNWSRSSPAWTRKMPGLRWETTLLVLCSSCFMKAEPPQRLCLPRATGFLLLGKTTGPSTTPAVFHGAKSLGGEVRRSQGGRIFLSWK